MSLTGKNNGHILVGSINKCDLLTITAYGIAVKNGYEGTEEEWLLSLQGGAVIDKTLSISGVAADAKSTGNAIKSNTTAINEVKASVANVPNLINNHVADNLNPHKVTAKQVGLDKVNNTADLDKPVSTAQATAIADAKKAGTDAQTAADNAHTAIDNHKEDKNNPHTVTCEQIGAATKAYADTKTVMTMVWENASPTSSFGDQKLSLDLSQFTHIAVEYNNGTTSAEANSPIGTVTCPIGKTLYLYQAGVTARFIYTGKTQIHVGAANSNKNGNLIPLRFYGIKIAGAFEEVLPSAEGVDF